MPRVASICVCQRAVTRPPCKVWAGRTFDEHLVRTSWHIDLLAQLRSCLVGDSCAVRRVAVSMSLFLFLCRVPYEPTPHPDWIKEVCEYAQQAGANMPADLIWWNVKSAPPAYRRFLRAACRAARAEANEAIARVREAGQCRNMKRQKVSEAAK